MNLTKTHIATIAVVTACIVAYFVIAAQPGKLEYRDRAFPQGFRDLVVGGTVSAINPLADPPTARRATSKDEICTTLFRDPNSPSAGNREGSVPLVTFFDYRCPYCRTLTGIIAAMPTDHVRIVFHEWAILGESSVAAARAALAADRQGKYLAFHTRLMNSRFIPTVTYLEALAAELGMDQAKLRQDMNSDAITLALARTATLASALGFSGTPALVVGRTIVQGDITRAQLERLIEDEARQPAPRTC